MSSPVRGPLLRSAGLAGRTFTVLGLASAQLPMRILGLFAQQDRVPMSFRMVRADDRITISIRDDTLDQRRADVLLEKMRMIVEVEAATIT